MTQANSGVVDEIYEDLGGVAFEAALLRFVPDLSESESEAFQSYVETNVAKATFMEDLYRDYPDFGQLLDDELKNLQTELNDVVEVTNDEV
jgi:hypothetical protein